MNPADNILAIDPGPERSAWVWLEDGEIRAHHIDDNEVLLCILKQWERSEICLVVEFPECMGMPAGRSLFETAFWVGRYVEAWPNINWDRVYRKEIKLHLCGTSRAKDGNVRQALLGRWGPQGTKKAPGKTYGISKDVWAALAVATYYMDTRGK